MSKHTPGPWRLDETFVKTEWNNSERWVCEIVSPDGNLIIADIPEYRSYPEDTAEIEANARLIAAAPDLLSAAVDALSDFCWIEQTVPNSNFQASILKLKHAIQKTNGPGALAVNVVERAPENNHEGIRPGSANGETQ